MRRPMLVVCLAALAVAVALPLRSAAQSVPARVSAAAEVLRGVAGADAPAADSDGSPTAAGSVRVPGVRIRSAQATVETSRDRDDPSAEATAVARSVSLLGGRVSAFGVRRTATATDGGRSFDGSVEGLRIDGRLVGDVTRPRTFRLSDGSVVTVNRGGTGLRLFVLTDSGGLAGGTDVRIAVVSASARAGSAPDPTPTATPEPTPAPTRTATPAPTRTATPEPRRRRAPSVQRRLTRSGFAFPVYPPQVARVADNYGGYRPPPIVSHEGVDIFAKFGSPVVAVADGRLSKVGTLPISGNRLWLTTSSGDAFFYAHLSSFSDGAVSGREVEAGTVLGFTGNTGDAEPTPPHVHFEVHPGGIEAPSVDPYPIVTAWQDRDDVPAGAFLRREGADTATRPGSLVAVRDFLAE